MWFVLLFNLVLPASAIYSRAAQPQTDEPINEYDEVFVHVQGPLQMSMKRWQAPFVLVAEHRSGSGMVSRLLDSHPDIASFGELYQSFPHTSLAVRNGENLDITFLRLMNNPKAMGSAWIGFRLQNDQLPNVRGGIFENKLNPTFIFHFRRNVLRQIISYIAHMQQCLNASRADDTECAHPTSESGLADAQAFKPYVDPTTLVAVLDKEFAARRDLMGAARAHSKLDPRCVSHYEDWLDPQAQPAQMGNIEACLGAPQSELTVNTYVIHQNRPISEVIANYGEVKGVLQGTQYAYLLEEFASPAEVFERLKMSDTLGG